ELFNDVKTELLAYAESWLLVYDLFQTESGVKKLQTYLAALRKRRDSGRRVEDAEAAFGKLDRLDADLKKTARRMR
ncbi:MAG: hypothetical protein LC745_04280, partial [Planctomycetia bacterium]|nr:hypothetical protein [Planctomycetia bacterium]